MIVILAEKRSAADNFAKALGASLVQRQPAAVFEGTYNNLPFRIVHAVGHCYGFPKNISEMVSDDLVQRYKIWSLDYLPWNPGDIKWKIRLDSSKKDVVSVIKDNLGMADEVCIATDNDPTGEGDLLAWEILRSLKWNGYTSRMIFEDESPKSVCKAFENRFEVESFKTYGPYQKAEARAKFDYLSMQLSRVATIVAKNRGYDATLRQGRLKSTMVFMIGNQLELIKNYKKIPFYEARYRDDNGHTYKRKEDAAVRVEKESMIDLSEFEDSPVIVDSVEKKTSAPGKLLDLAGLVSSLVEKNGFSSEKLLSVYQDMYSASIVSYPRTEDKAITPEQYEQLKTDRFKIARVVGVDASLLTYVTQRKKHLQKTAAHGANRPGTNIPESLDQIRTKYGAEGVAIYDLLARSALAIFGEDYVYEHQVGHIEKHPDFIGFSNIPVDPGYKMISNEMSDDKSEDADEGKSTPLGTTASSFIHEGSNPKPKKPTMKWLIGKGGQLEKYNVGTGATRTSIFNEVISAKDPKKQLVKMTKKGDLSITNVGEVSYALLKGCYISSPKVTEDLLHKMDEVGDFSKSVDEVINTITPITIHDMKVMIENGKSLPEGKDAVRMSVPRVTGIYAPTGEEITFVKGFSGHIYTDAEVDRLLKGETISFDAKTKKGKNYQATGELGKRTVDGKVIWGFTFSQLTGTYIPTGEEITFPRAFSGHTFTKDEVQDLLQGEAISFEAINKKGSAYTANGSLQKDSKSGRWQFSFLQRRGIYEPTGEEISFPLAFSGHTFTDDEARELLAGKMITFEAISKKNTTYTAKGCLKAHTRNGIKQWGFEFAEREVPEIYCGHTFTEIEAADLLAGNTLHLTDMVSKKGNTFECDLKWNRKTGRFEMFFGDEKKAGNKRGSKSK